MIAASTDLNILPISNPTEDRNILLDTRYEACPKNKGSRCLQGPLREECITSGCPLAKLVADNRLVKMSQ